MQELQLIQEEVDELQKALEERSEELLAVNQNVLVLSNRLQVGSDPSPRTPCMSPGKAFREVPMQHQACPFHHFRLRLCLHGSTTVPQA